MKPETSNAFVIGFAVGYCIRHFVTPRQSQAWEWWVAGIIVFFAICVWLAANTKKPKSKGKAN